MKSFTPLAGALLLLLFACLPVFAQDYNVLEAGPVPDYGALLLDASAPVQVGPQHVAFMAYSLLDDAADTPVLPLKSELFKSAAAQPRSQAAPQPTGLILKRGACGGAGCSSAACASAGCNVNGACQAPACQAPTKNAACQAPAKSTTRSSSPARRGPLVRLRERRNGGNSNSSAQAFACASCR